MASSGRHFIRMFNSSQYEQMMKVGGVKIGETRDRFLNIQLKARSSNSNEPVSQHQNHQVLDNNFTPVQEYREYK